MDDLIQDLLSYVRITQADLTARPEPVEEAIESMQGRCRVESWPGAESRFWIELPVAPL